MNKKEAEILGKETRIGLANIYRDISHHIFKDNLEQIKRIDEKADKVIQNIKNE